MIRLNTFSRSLQQTVGVAVFSTHLLTTFCHNAWTYYIDYPINLIFYHLRWKEMTICIHGTVVVDFSEIVIHVIGILGIGRQTQTP